MVLVLVAARLIYDLSDYQRHRQAEQPQVERDSQELLQRIEALLEQQIADSPFEVSLFLYDLHHQLEIDFHGSRSIYPASMIKNLILVSALQEVERKRISLDESFQLRQEDKYEGDTPVTGTGVLQFSAAGEKYTLEELLILMIAESDNIAANMILDRLGRERINSLASGVAMEDTAVNRRMFELESPYPSNSSSARDLTNLLIALVEGELLGDSLTTRALDIMSEGEYRERIGRYLDREVRVANKLGTVSTMVGDTALIFFPDRSPVAVTIIVEKPEEIGVEMAEREIGRLVSTLILFLEFI